MNWYRDDHLNRSTSWEIDESCIKVQRQFKINTDGVRVNQRGQRISSAGRFIRSGIGWTQWVYQKSLSPYREVVTHVRGDLPKGRRDTFGWRE